MKASEFVKTIWSLTGAGRDKQIVDVAKTDLRRWDWALIPLDDGRGFFRAAVDYVAIGDADDWVRVPMGASAAQTIADQESAVLPSPFMVELIHRAAKIKLRPIEMGTSKMMSTQIFVEHNAKIEGLREHRPGLISGVKKDIVVSNKLETKPKFVCIYGWYRENGQPIQSISTKHEKTYSDYSHGVRLVHPEMVLDDKTVLVQDVLRDPRVAAVLTGGKAWGQRHDAPDDGVLRIVRYGTQPAKNEVAQPSPATTSKNEPLPNGPLTFGERCLEWCLAEMRAGVKEEPRGSKTSPRIVEYLAPARRRGTEKLLGIKAADWCAVAQCAALAANSEPNADVPHGYRAAVRELREDAQQTGAWVPIADVRDKKYEVRRGDLVVLRRGTAGLGHVARVEGTNQSAMFTIGGNEDDTWKRTARNFADKDIEGVISYHQFNPGLKLQPTSLSSSPPQASPVAPAPDNVDAWARGVLLRAWESMFPGKPITDAERQTLLAIARHERAYGHAKKPAAGIGMNNWGGTQCAGRGPCADHCYPGGDKDAHGDSYPACFKKYATPEAGAADMIFQVTTRRPDVWDAMKSGNLTTVADRMSQGRTVNGKWVGVYHETPMKIYANALWANVQIIAKSLGESLSVRLAENVPTTPGAPKHTPAYAPTAPAKHTPPYPPHRANTGRQRGIRALIASRRPDLASVVVGAPEPPAMQAAHINTAGLSTSTQVIDHANRVDDYVRALHQIVADARKNGVPNDTFPWTEWAAFRVSWDMVYFDITHSFFVNFDDNVVIEYETQARQWEDIIAKHYKSRPSVRPVVDAYAGLKIAGGVALGLGLLYAITKGAS